MANYYTDIPELKYHLNNPMMERICELKERNYRDKEEFDYAPQDYADAMDSFDKVLEITGEITGEIIAPNAEGSRRTPCAPKSWPLPMLDSETSGRCKIVSRHYMNSETKTSTAVSFRVSAPVKRCLWT